jgi:hypothetical protein
MKKLLAVALLVNSCCAMDSSRPVEFCQFGETPAMSGGYVLVNLIPVHNNTKFSLELVRSLESALARVSSFGKVYAIFRIDNASEKVEAEREALVRALRHVKRFKWSVSIGSLSLISVQPT